MSRYISFQVGERLFALALPMVLRVLNFESVTKVPLAPPFVEGILNLGGEVVPVINLRTRLDLPPLPLGPRHRVIVAGRSGGSCGLLVDKVRGILEVERGSIAPPAAGIPGLKPEVLEGMVQSGEALLFILDVQRLLAPQGQAAD